jgi:hypothetical protein
MRVGSNEVRCLDNILSSIRKIGGARRLRQERFLFLLKSLRCLMKLDSTAKQPSTSHQKQTLKMTLEYPVSSAPESSILMLLSNTQPSVNRII